MKRGGFVCGSGDVQCVKRFWTGTDACKWIGTATMCNETFGKLQNKARNL
jgi:hypothetical protein